MPVFLIRTFVPIIMACYLLCLRIASALRPRRPRAGGAHILLTGAFYSNNWIASHLGPIARSTACQRLRVVSTFPIEPLDKLELIVPPLALRRLVGDTGARLITFFWVGLGTRPDFVGGFHLLINGLLAQLLARMTGARAVYFCVGGPAEVLGGGIESENRLFERLRWPSSIVETQLLKAVRGFDLVITMGTRARRFFEERGVQSRIQVISGGLDATRYRPSLEVPKYDLIFVGRLVPIKRVDLFLECVRSLALVRSGLSAVVVGDGRLRGALEARARNLGIGGHVQFVGQKSNIASWLRQSRIFLLTSDSEGLSLALIEAMLCGLPAIVSDVGDLGDLVEDGRNGYLIAGRSAEPFAAKAAELLENMNLYTDMARAARQAAERFELEACSRQWDAVLSQD